MAKSIDTSQTRNLLSVQRMYLKLVQWDNDNGVGSCYVYSNRMSYTASLKHGDVSQSFNVTIKKQGADSSTVVTDDVTMWLSEWVDGKSVSLSDEDIALYRDVYGTTCYGIVYDDGSVELMSDSSFIKASIPQTYINASIPA